MSDNIDKNINEDLTQQENNIEVVEQEVKDDVKQVDETKELSFFDKVIQAKTKPTETSYLPGKEDFKKELEERAGRELEDEEVDEAYKHISDYYNELAREELENAQVFSSFDYMFEGAEDDVNFVDEGDYQPTLDVTVETNSGAKRILDTWTDPTRSVRKGSILSKKWIDHNGEVRELNTDLFDGMVGNKEFANDEGKNIIGYTYLPSDPYARGTGLVKAFYEGEEPDGEVVSRWDANGRFLNGNDLDFSTWKVPIASTFNFAVNLVDTALALSENVSVIATHGGVTDTEFYKDLRDVRNKLQSFNVSKSDWDQQKMFTVNNMVDLGINVGLQLLTARGLATAFGKILGASAKSVKKLSAMQQTLQQTTDPVKKKALRSSIDKLTATIQKAGKGSQRSTLFMLGAMAAKDASQEAKHAGFTDLESAYIYAASLGGMMWVNQLSNLGFERVGLNRASKITNNISKRIFNENTAAKVVKNPKSLKGLVSKYSDDLIKKYKEATSKTGYASHMLSEATEEEAELLMQEVVNHTANLYSALGYREEDRPKFKTVFDEGYWGEFMTESVMSVLGGAMGGAMARGLFIPKSELNKIKESELPVTGKEADAFKRVAYMSTRTQEGAQWEDMMMTKMKDKREKGLFGREDISTLWDKELGRYKRMTELTEEESEKYFSQAETAYRASMAQYQYYKLVFANESGKFEDIVKNNPNFAHLTESQQLQDATMDKIQRKSEILNSADLGTMEIDTLITKLSDTKNKLKKDEDGKVDDAKYQEELTEVSGATKLSVKDVEELVEINQFQKDVSSGAILENAFIDLQLTSENYRDVFSPETFRMLIESDSEAQDSYQESKLLLKELQDKMSESFDKVSEEGGLTDEQKSILLSGKAVLNPDTKERLLEVVRNTGVPLVERKKAAAMHVLNSMKTNGLLQNEEKYYGQQLNFLANLEKTVNTDPSALPQTIEGMLDKIPPDYEVYPFTQNEEVEAVKLAYANKTLKKIATAKSESELSDILYDEKDVTAANYAADYATPDFPFAGTSLEGEPLMFNESPNAAPIYDAVGFSEDAKEKAQLLDAINNTQSVENADENRPDALFDFDDSNPNKIKYLTSSLEEKYLSLTGGEENPRTFANLSGAKKLADKLRMRIKQLHFLVENVPALLTIQQINEEQFGELRDDLTYFTKHLNKIVDTKAIRENDAYKSQYLLNLVQQQVSLIKLLEKTERLTKLAENSSVDLQKAYFGDAVSYASDSIESVSAVFLRDGGQAVIQSNPALEGIEDLTIGLNYEDTDQINVKKLFDSLYEIRRKLQKARVDNPKFVDELVTHLSDKKGTDKSLINTILLTLSPSDYIFSRMRSVYDEAIKAADSVEKLEALQLPTISQLRLAEEAVTASTTSFLYYANILRGSKTKMLPIAVFSGAQGTGKTQVVGKDAAKYAQEVLYKLEQDKASNKLPKILFASNSESQAKNLRVSAEKGDVVSGSLEGKKDVTQEDLWNLFVGSDLSVKDIADKLTDIGAIFYDEIADVEFDASTAGVKKGFDNPKEAFVLNAILAKLSQVNDYRKSLKQEALVLIGLGDTAQGGYMEGSPSPRNPDGKEQLTGRVFSVTDPTTSVYKGSVELKHPFRYRVGELIKAPKEILEKLDPRMRLDSKEMQPVTFNYNFEEGTFTGVKKSNTWNDIINDEDLAQSIRTKLGAPNSGGNFTILVVTGKHSYDGVVDSNSALGKLLKEYEGDERILLRGFYNVKGSEADYVLVNMPKDHFIHSKEEVESPDFASPEQLTNRLRIMASVIGRAHTFTNIAVTGDYPIHSNKSTTTIIPVNETNEFKRAWSEMLSGAILSNYDVIPESVIPNIEVGKESDKSGFDTSVTDEEGIAGVSDPYTSSATESTEYANSVARELGIEELTEDNVIAARELAKELEDSSTGTDKDNAGSLKVLLNNIFSVIKNENEGEVISFDDSDPIGNNSSFQNMSDKKIMQEIEKQEGKILFFGQLGQEVTQQKSLESKRNYSSHLYDNVPSAENFKPEFYSALGLGPSGTSGMRDYKYHVVSYEFATQNRVQAFNHVIVAENKNGEKFIIGTLGKRANYDPNGDIAKWMDAREEKLKLITEAYANDEEVNVDEVLTPSERVSFSEMRNDFMLPDSGRRGSKFNKQNRFFIYNEVPNGANIIDGVTVGNTDSGNSVILNLAKQIDEVRAELPNIDKLSAGEFVKSKLDDADTVNRIDSFKEKGKFIPVKDIVSTDTKQRINPFEIINGNMFYSIGGYDILGIKLRRGTVYFAKSTKAWVPVLGLNTTDNTLILDNESLKPGANYDAEFTKISNSLRNLRVDKNFQKKFSDSTFSERVASLMGYKTTIFSEISNKNNLKKELRRISTENTTNTFFGNSRLTLKTAIKLWNKTGAPYSISKPYVIMRGENAGKSMIFYSFDRSKNLLDMSEDAIMSEYNAMLDNMKNNPTAMTSNRNNLGYILLDSKPTTIQELNELYLGVSNKGITDKFNKVVIRGNAESRLISLLAHLHIAINRPTSTSKVYQLLEDVDDNINKDAVYSWVKSKGDSQLKDISTVLRSIFQDENLGKIAMTNTDEALNNFIEDIKKYKDNRQMLDSIYDSYYSVNATQELLDRYGINKNNMTDLLITGGEGSVGKIVLNKHGVPAVYGTESTVIKYIPSSLVNSLSQGEKSSITPSLDLLKMFTLIHSTSLTEDSKNNIFEQLDEIMPNIDGLGKGLMVSPLAVDNKNPISRAITSTKQPLSEMLTTNVKQIKEPSIVFDVHTELDSISTPRKQFRVAEEKSSENKNLSETTYEDRIKSSDLRELSRIQKEVNKDNSLSSDEKLNISLKIKERVKSLRGEGSSVFDFRKMSLVEFVGDTVTPEVKVVLEQFDKLRPVIKNKEELDNIWVQGLITTLNNQLNSQISKYISNIQQSSGEMVQLSDIQVVEAAKTIVENNESIPKLDIEGFDVSSLELKWDTNQDNMGNRLAMLLSWSVAEGDEKAKLRDMLLTNPNDPELIDRRRIMDEEVLFSDVLQANVEDRVNLLRQYFSNVINNYYNITSQANAISMIREVLETVPDSYVGKAELTKDITDYYKNTIVESLRPTFAERASSLFANNQDFVDNVDKDIQNLVIKEVVPLIESMQNVDQYLEFLQQGTPSDPTKLNMNHITAQSEFSDLLNESLRIPNEAKDKILEAIDIMVACK
jgi:hypothetical protein